MEVRCLPGANLTDQPWRHGNGDHLTVPKYTPAVASKGRVITDVTATKAVNFFDPRRGSSDRRRYSDREVASSGPMLREAGEGMYFAKRGEARRRGKWPMAK